MDYCLQITIFIDSAITRSRAQNKGVRCNYTVNSLFKLGLFPVTAVKRIVGTFNKIVIV